MRKKISKRPFSQTLMCGRKDTVKAEEKDCDATDVECSSSFGDTCSNYDGDEDLRDCASSSERRVVRRNVHEKWRKLVHPFAWRFRWLEVRIAELARQKAKYDKCLASMKSKEADEKANDPCKNCLTRDDNDGMKMMKRMKRRRCEDKLDASRYLSSHKIISESWNDPQKCVCCVDNCKVMDGDSQDTNAAASLFANADEFTKSTFSRKILSKIEIARARVRKLKALFQRAFQGKENLQNELSSKDRFNSDDPVLAVNQKSDTGADLQNSGMRRSTENSVGTNMDAASVLKEMFSNILAANNFQTQSQLEDFCSQNAEDVLIDNHLVQDTYLDLPHLGTPREVPQKLAHETMNTDDLIPTIVEEETITGVELPSPADDAPPQLFPPRRRGRPAKANKTQQSASPAAAAPQLSDANIPSSSLRRSQRVPKHKVLS